MIKKSKNGTFVFPRLEEYSGLFHSISTVDHGDMSLKSIRGQQSIKKFADMSGIAYTKMIFMDQYHTNKIKEVTRNTAFKYNKVDSLITNKKLILNAFSADCVPIIFYDPATSTTAIAHSGWKGTYKNIVSTVVKSFIKNKINPSSIIVGIGPSIKSCCYMIEQIRFDKFEHKYRDWIKLFTRHQDGKIYLDLVQLIKLQLLELDIKPSSIEDSGICTYDSDEFFSFRKQSDKTKIKLFMTSIGSI